MLFFSNPNTQNAAQIFIAGENFAEETYDINSLLSLDGTDFAFKASSYNFNIKDGETSCLYAVTKELFNADRGFLSGEICDEMTKKGEKIKLLALGETDLAKGNTGTLDNGKDYVIVDVIRDSSLQKLIGVISFKSFLLAYDDGTGDFEVLAAFTPPVIYEKLSDSVSFEAFSAANLNETSYSIREINPHQIMSSDFSSSFSMSVIGGTVFLAAAIGIFINSYLIFEKNKKDYRALSVIGMRKGMFLSEYVTEKAVLLALSLVISISALIIMSNVFESGFITLISAVISAFAVILILAICTLMYSIMLRKCVVGK